MKRLIIFLVRKHLGLKLYQPFQFVEQKSKAVYYFTEDAIMKAWRGSIIKSGVSLNWLLDDDCRIRKCDEQTDEESK